MADRTTSSITVSAPRTAVMSVIADFAAYSQWATGVRSAEVIEPGSGGRPRQVRFVLDAGIIKDSYVLAYQWDADSGVHWDLSGAGSMISEMSGGYLLADAGEGTRVTYELSVGLRVPMIAMLKRRAEKTIVDTALKGLKSRTESLPAAGSADVGPASGGGHE
jgi:carbon monoxide dehydrogenase subunit G